MNIGVVFPQTEIGPAVADVRTYATEVERMGFKHLLAYDHVVGADPEHYKDWDGPYDIDTQFHEPFVMFGYLAACTNLELVTGIIIAPQRQTALIAKQAAEVDLLSNGKFRLGLGIGWNAVEYEALGQDFSTRGRRLGEQVQILRRLWTERSVSMSGRFDQITAAGLAPLPIQRPIPVWLGGSSPKAYARIGQLADGWFPMVQPGKKLDDALGIVASSATESGRDPATIKMEGRVDFRGDAEDVASRISAWGEAGASHVGISTMRAGLSTVTDHLRALEATAKALDLS
ncbi:MAG: LLM class F420-dependent oxidoreductase [Acidimicrobiales bacterium]